MYSQRWALSLPQSDLARSHRRKGKPWRRIMEQTRRSLELLDIERRLAALEVAAGR